MKFVYKNDPKKSIKSYEYKKAEIQTNDSSITKLVKNLENNGIGVNKILENSRSLGLELTQFVHSDIALVEQNCIKEASKDSGINKNIKKDIKIADLDAITEIDESFNRNAKTIYERNTARRFNTYTSARFQPFKASREFFKGAFLIENDSEFIIRDNLFSTQI